MKEKIYVGKTKAEFIEWIKNRYPYTPTPGPEPEPVGHPETRITFSDGSSDTYEWSGKIDYQNMINSGLAAEEGNIWIKEPVTIDIGNTVTSIGDSAFAWCSSLTSVTIPNSVTSIGNQAFIYCSLTSVMIGNRVTSIGDNAFEGCVMTSVTIPDSVTSIGGWAFAGCEELESVMIPDNVTSIGEGAFYDCSVISVTIVANDGDAETVKSKMITAGVNENIEWIMPE